MIITGMAEFESICLNKLVDWYNNSSLIHKGPNDVQPINLGNVFYI